MPLEPLAQHELGHLARLIAATLCSLWNVEPPENWVVDEVAAGEPGVDFLIDKPDKALPLALLTGAEQALFEASLGPACTGPQPICQKLNEGVGNIGPV